MELFSIGFIGLFSASFLSATILPMSSEGILLLMLSQQYDPI
jgi:membrane protein YqaA with SNARE-associated domain